MALVSSSKYWFGFAASLASLTLGNVCRAQAAAGGLPAAPAPEAPAAVSDAEISSPPTATPVLAAPVVETPPARAAEPEPLAKEPPAAKSERLKIGGGGILWYYQPTEGDQKNNVEFYNIHLTFDVNFGDGFGFFVEPRVRDTKLRSFYDGTAWIEEGYASYRLGTHTFKLGKIYGKLGLFWDNSFWGNVQVYDGLKLAPDYGASVEGKFELAPQWGLGYAAQYFAVDGRTNISLPGRDTVSIPDSRRRNEVVLRVDPYVKFLADGQARLGLSGERLEADSPGLSDESVLRYAIDFKASAAGFGVWGEYLHQKGRTVTEYPIAATPATDDEEAIPGRASEKIDYYELGAEYTYDRFTLRYNLSAVRYRGVGVKEWIHVPALAVKLTDALAVSGEYVHWTRSIDGVSEKYNRSLNALLYVNF